MHRPQLLRNIHHRCACAGPSCCVTSTTGAHAQVTLPPNSNSSSSTGDAGASMSGAPGEQQQDAGRVQAVRRPDTGGTAVQEACAGSTAVRDACAGSTAVRDECGASTTGERGDASSTPEPAAAAAAAAAEGGMRNALSSGGGAVRGAPSSGDGGAHDERSNGLLDAAGPCLIRKEPVVSPMAPGERTVKWGLAPSYDKVGLLWTSSSKEPMISPMARGGAPFSGG